MAPNVDVGDMLRRFVKIIDFSDVLPKSQTKNHKYHILLGGSDMPIVQDAIKKVEKIFGVENIMLTSGNAAIPEAENIQILMFFDDLRAETKTEIICRPNRQNLTARSPRVSNLNNSLGYFLDTIRANSVTDTTIQENSVTDTTIQENSSSSETVTKDAQMEFVPQQPKRKRVRKHKRKRQPELSENVEDEMCPGEETTPAEIEPEPNGYSNFQAILSLKDQYEKAPIFRKME